jgi:hypothetical protein
MVLKYTIPYVDYSKGKTSVNTKMLFHIRPVSFGRYKQQQQQNRQDINGASTNKVLV